MMNHPAQSDPSEEERWNVGKGEGEKE